MPKINTREKYPIVVISAALMAAALLVVSGTVAAQSVLQGYASDEKLERGMLVALKEGDESKVVPLTDLTQDKFKGVIVQQNDSPVTLSSEERNNFVATVGPYEVLVSNEFGPIKKGDYIGISSTSGIGSRATEAHAYVYGVAAGEFTGGSDTISTGTNQAGKTTKVGRVLVDVSYGRNPFGADPNKNKVPEVLKRIGESIADKPVTSIRIYIALAVFLGTGIIAGTMLYSGIRSAVISIGRNPLSKVSIYRGLVQVILFGLIVFITGVFGVYLILKL